MATIQLGDNTPAIRQPRPMDDRLATARRMPLADLNAQCRSDNRPETVCFGPPVGREAA